MSDSESPEAPRRRGRPPGGRRDEILVTALEVFAEGGYNGTSLATVAERVGLTQQGLLHYFPSKQALLVAMLAKRDELDAPVGAHHRLADLARIVDRNTRRRGVVQVYSVLSAESVTEGHPARRYFTDRFARVREGIAASFAEECGPEPPGGLSPEQAAALLVAAMDGLQLQWLHDPDAVDMPALLGALVHALTGSARGEGRDPAGD